MDMDDNDSQVEDAKRQNQYRELLLLSRPNRITKAFSRVPKPKEALPTNPLPLWHLLSLDHKVPSVPAPDGHFVITREYISRGVSFFLLLPTLHQAYYIMLN